jgi:hypothetical protein
MVSVSLTSCSGASGNSQPAMIVFELGNLELMPLTEGLEIKVKGSSAIKVSEIENSHKNNREMNGDVKWGENFDLLPDCDGWVRECGTFEGVRFNQTKAIDFFGQDSFVRTNLDINEEGKAILNVSEEGRSGTWEFETSQGSDEPIYLKILITDYYVGVTELENGYLTFTSNVLTEEIPEKDYGFDEFIGDEELLFQRPNNWLNFMALYDEFSIAEKEAENRTCEIFGPDCDGTASWGEIQEAYMTVYEEDIYPMVSNIKFYTYSSDSDVRKAVLMLTQTGDLLASCYFRTQLAAQSRDDSAYNAVSSCWSDVDQKIGDLEIYLTDFDVVMNLYPRTGDY